MEEIIKRKIKERQNSKKKIEQLMEIRREILLTANPKEKDEIFKEVGCDIINLKLDDMLIIEFNDCLKEFEKTK